MRLITLNSWGGRSLYLIMRFLKKHASNTDIFCFQEIHKAAPGVVEERHPDQYVCGQLFDKIQKELKEFDGTFACFEDDPNRMSQAIFIRKGIKVKRLEDFIVFKPAVPKEIGDEIFSPRKLQYAIIETPKGEMLVANYHGLWVNGPKTDSPERIEQSKRIREFLDSFKIPRIICGDFNLLPETESVKILEKGMRNLINEFKVESTRTPLYRHYNNPDEPNFADYIFTSQDVEIQKFEVLPDIASDHAPLLLEFK